MQHGVLAVGYARIRCDTFTFDGPCAFFALYFRDLFHNTSVLGAPFTSITHIATESKGYFHIKGAVMAACPP